MPDVAILIPAAGASSRMRGRDKLLEQVDGQPLLARQVRMALASGAGVLVTLPPGDTARRAVLEPSDRLTVQDIPQAAEGIAASLRTGARWAQEHGASGLMVLLADLPDLQQDDLAQMLAAFSRQPERPVRAVDSAGRPGHPVIFPARLFPALAHVTGDHGARAVLAREEVTALPLPENRATTDLDTPEAWTAWRARTGR